MRTAKAFSLVAGILTLWLAAASGQTFIPASSPVAGANPDSVAVLDVNGDGKLDIVVANGSAKTLTVLTNNGGGIFVSNTVYTTPVTPVLVVTADVNGDGKPDLIYASSDNNTLTVFTNNGGGIFVSNAVYTLPGSPYDFVAADINGDGKVDLIAADYNGYAVTVLTNNGTGGFVSSGSFSCNSQYPRWIAVADFNGDGKPDLAVADYFSPHSLAIMINNGNGNFSLSSSVAISGYAFAVATADVNGDGKPDLIGSAGTGGNTLSVTTNNGNGTFTSVADYTVGSAPSCVVVTTNLNGDGRMDLISANGDNSITVLTNNGSGLFAQEQNTQVGIGAYFVAVADVNGDGKPDLIVANPGTNTLTILTNASVSLTASLAPLITGFSPSAGYAGTNVVITGTNFTGTTAVYFNGTNASFTVNSNSQITATVPANAPTGPISVVTPKGTAVSTTNFTIFYPPLITSFSPTNGIIGTNVVIIGANFTNATAVYFNGTNASFLVNSNSQITATVPTSATTGPVTVVTPYGTAVSTTNFTVIYPPLITSFSPIAGYVGTSVTITGVNFTNATTVSFNGTNASFTVNSNSQITATVPANATNGFITVVTPSGTAVSTNIFTLISGPVGYYPGNFTLASAPHVGNAPQSVALATNFNGHGALALVSANYADKTLTILTNNGGGIFVSNTSYATSVGPVCVVAADVNNDGKPDLIYSSPDNDTLTVLTNNGSGVFGSNAVYSVDGQPYGFVAADVNGDGRPDLIAGGYDTGYVTVLTNNNTGSGKFTLSGNFTSGGGNMRWVAVADFNGDGRPDLAISLYSAGLVLVFTNNGGGTFNFTSAVTVGGYSFAVTAADVNGDGRPDLISSGSAGGNVLTVCTNNGNGTFTNAVNYPTGANPTCLINADVNGDGRPDLISVNSGDSTLTMLTNNSGNGFTNSATVNIGSGSGPAFVVAADVNGDGHLDLITANTSANTLSILTNAPSYHLGLMSFFPASGSPGAPVTITGTNLSTVTSVLFNGVTAGFTIVSDGQITATVPSCILSGPLAIINASESATSAASFTFVKLPAIVTDPVESELDYALCNDSTITFGFDGTINISATKVISSDITLDGSGHNVTISGSNSVGIFQVNSGHVTLKNLTIANGHAASGGGLLNQGGTVTIINCTFTNNVAVGPNGTNAGGGAICNQTFLGGMTVLNSTFMNNTAVGGTGLTGTQGPNSSTAGGPGGTGGYGLGGGIYNGNSSYMLITNCTFNNNRAIGGNGGTGGPGFNGYNYQFVCGSYCCDYFFGCDQYCNNYCTASANGSAGGSGGVGGNGYGGAVYDQVGSLSFINSTIVGGSAAGGTGGTPGGYGFDYAGGFQAPVTGPSGTGSGGNLYFGNGVMSFKNTIVANPVSGANYAYYPSGGIYPFDAGNNLCSDASMGLPASTSLNNVNPNLGSLTNNGGLTLTMALLPASPAVRAGTTNGAPATDQRGQPRKSLQIDIGAFETPVTPATIRPVLAGIKSSRTNLFQLSFTNMPGTSFSLWSATNLVLPFSNWTFLGYPRETAPGQFQFSDPNSTNNPFEFYRVSSP